MKLVTSFKQFTIRNQMVSMFVVVMLPLFAASIILLLNMRTIIKEKSLNTAMSHADGLKYRITDIVESTEAAVNSFSSDEEIINFLTNNYQDSSMYYNYYNDNPISEYLSIFPQIKNIAVFVPRKDFMYNSDYIYIDDEILNSSWYENVPDDGSVTWDVIKDPHDGKYYLSCLKAIIKDKEIIGISAAMISIEWINDMLPNEQLDVVLSVGNGKVYYSNCSEAVAGTIIEPEGDFLVSEIRKSYDYGFFDYRGYTVLENFYTGHRFQIILLLPSSYVNSEVNSLSVVYGGYCGLLIILSFLIIILFTSVFSRRIKLLSEKMHAVAGGNFDVEFNDSGNDEISNLYSDLGQMISDMQKLIDDNYKAQLRDEAFKFNQMEAEFKALASQINPHFLYNTLETIRMKAYCNEDKETADLIKKLGKFMRRCLEFKDGEVTLRSELEFTNSYLELQSARFGDRISYSIYSEVAKDYMILPLLIQPIVENAFVHGIESNKSNGRIEIKVYYHGEYVFVDVKDNGQGITRERLAELEKKLEISDTSSGKSIGLTNVHKRIKMYHGEQYGMSIKSNLGVGTVIRLALPRNPQESLINSAEKNLKKMMK